MSDPAPADIPLAPGTLASARGMIAHLRELAGANTVVSGWVLDLAGPGPAGVVPTPAGPGPAPIEIPAEDIPIKASAAQLARLVGQRVAAVTVWLSRHAASEFDREELRPEDRVGNNRYLYVTARVLPRLRGHFTAGPP